MNISLLPIFNKQIYNDNKHVLWSGLDKTGRSTFIELIIKEQIEKSFFIICESDKRVKELSVFLKQVTSDPVISLFEQSYLPVEILARDEEHRYEKSLALYLLSTRKRSIIVANISSLIEYIPTPTYYHQSCHTIKIGDVIEQNDLLELLVDLGYQSSGVCDEKGFFAKRGNILDVYMPNYPHPIRIEWFDDEIESIRFFSESTQKTINNANHFEIIPAQDFFFNQDTKEEIVLSLNNEISKLSDIYIEEKKLHDVDENILRYYAYKSKRFQGNILDYIHEHALIIIDEIDRVEQQIELRYQLIFSQLEQLINAKQIVPSKIKNIPDDTKLGYHLSNIQIIGLSHIATKSSLFDTHHIIQYYIHENNIKTYPIQKFVYDLKNYLSDGYYICFHHSSNEVIQTLAKFLTEYGIRFSIKISLKNLLNFEQVVLVKEKLHFNCVIENDRVVFLNANIFNIKDASELSRESKKNQENNVLIEELSIGDYIVHENHGIGIYLGIEHKKNGDIEKDYIVIQYKGADKLYVPLDQLSFIDKYIGREDKKPKIHKLGSVEWIKSKSRIKKSIEDMAEQLLELHAKREIRPGFAFAPDDALQYEFERSFPYMETPDQLRAIKEVKADMEKPIAMDRLICGDVGYGKTEVAIRAAFKSVCNGKQVAVLVPTTILAMQHYETFKTRMDEYGVEIALLTRFCTIKEQNIIFKKIQEHKIDIVIGTHKLFNKKLHFDDLGLLIVDEEQRFGVKHKEQIKALQENIDVLTMSATPIPRTLYFSLTGIKDMSIIETPPENRLPIQTYVTEEFPMIIEQAVQRELLRGGQIFVIYNNIQHLDEIASQYRELFPDCRVIIGHGRMKESELEDVILKFQNKEADILVCTTIIETGIDMPNVNTMLVHDSDHMGLAQLYQLKGRVGRSKRVAYAYLMYKKNKMLTDEAKKRLTTLQECTALGSGYKISKRDLEIRGSGNLLGSEQSGHVAEIGFELYLKMLNVTVEKLKNTPKISTNSVLIPVEIDVNFSAYIPENYIDNTKLRVTIYQRIDRIETEENLQEMAEELLDRFGKLPQAVLNLLKLVELKQVAQKAHSVSIKQRNTSLYVKINPNIEIDLQKLIFYIHHSKEKMFLKNINDETYIVIETKLKTLTPEYIDSLKLILTQLKYVVTGHNN